MRTIFPAWRLAASSAALVITGCTHFQREPLVQQPTTARAEVRPLVSPNGSTYQPAYVDFPLFEDLRPRNVGDVLTVVLNENVSASKNSNANAARNANLSVELKKVPKMMGGLLNDQGLDFGAGNTFKGSGGANANNTFTGQITVTVIELLPNGNLLVAGEKQIGINQGQEFIRFSGVVNPRNVNRNTVASAQVADARIEYVGKGFIDDSQTMGWLHRLWMKVAPF